MTIQELIRLVENRASHYKLMIKSHSEQGDVDAVIRFQNLLDETNDTIEKLNNLL